MKLNRCYLGDIITQRREKFNGDLIPICGVTREGFIPPKQKEADTSLYNVFYKKDFVFNPARMELNSIVYNDVYEKAICSSLYEIFYVHRPDIVLPEFLALIVKQNWFTRYCEFLSSGSAREYCRVANISQIELDYPNIEEQRKIVRINDTITKRIKIKRQINDNLVEQLQAYLFEFIKQDPKGNIGKLKDFSTMQYGYTETATLEDTGTKFLRITDIAQPQIDWYNVPFCKISDSDLQKYKLCNGDVVVARTGATVGVAKMIGNIIPNSVFASFLVRIRPIEDIYKYYFGLIITSKVFLEYVQNNAGGSAQPQANPPLLGEFNLIIPEITRMVNFNYYVSAFLQAIEANELEISKLTDISNTIITMISSR